MTKLSANIRDRRIELGMSQQELADKLGYKSRSAINKIELGINDLTQPKILAFAEALRTTPAHLMGWEESTTASTANKTVFSEKLKYYMDKNGIDRTQLCIDLGFKYSTVSEWLSAKKYPRIDKIELLANYFNIQKSNLIEREADEEFILTAQETDLIRAYREKPELQATVDKLLLG